VFALSPYQNRHDSDGRNLYFSSLTPIQECRRPQQKTRTCKFQIAVIDDEDFTPLENLRRNNYNITHMRDVHSIDALRRYHVILCDLIGVGMGLNSTMQGAHIIIEVKKSFPEKIIIAYTGGGRPELLQPSIQSADYFLRKDANLESWCELLDKSIGDLANPVTVWKKLRYKLLEVGLVPYQLAELEDDFVVTILKGEAYSINRLSREADRLQISPTAKAVLEHVIVHVGFELAREYIKGAA
jgi:hypothetical protein